MLVLRSISSIDTLADPGLTLQIPLQFSFRSLASA